MSDGLPCRRCSFLNRADDRYCERCGEETQQLIPPSPATATMSRPVHNGGPVRGIPPVQRDATTRYLCAAAHLDPAFSDRAIAEFLVEPVRALPPAPGVDSAAVLRDAVAARARRRIRDAILLLLLVVLAFVSPAVLLVWLIPAVGVFLGMMITSAGGTIVGSLSPALARSLGTAVGRLSKAVSIGLFAVAGIVAGIMLLPQLLALGLSGAESSDLSDVVVERSFFPYGALFIAILALVVIGIDQFIVHRLVYTSFRPGSFISDGRRARSDWERTVRTLGHGSFQQPLARLASVGEHGPGSQDLADVVVHRGFSPFIGAGPRIHRKIIPLPLEPANKDNASDNGSNLRPEPRPISVVGLHQHVAAAMNELRSSSSLGPSGRFVGLIQREQILMAADWLLANLDTQPQPAVLADLNRPPAAYMPAAAARHLADTPHEWARYYQCFRIEAWERDLTTSCYLHAGTDQRMLFLEWTFCVLPPIRSIYRAIDRVQHPFLDPLRCSLMEWVTLPATVLRRFRSVFHRFKPLAQRDGEVVPDRYGAGKSLRELAAGVDVQTYFQDVDAERYVKILDAALFRAVGEYLEDHGYSVVEFMKMADPVINQINSGNFFGSAVGFGSTVQGGTVQGNNINSPA
ncbi:MAG: hypothetical protein M3460_19535 [Actinomycetota bacterium]|nr:hypothetical protein [Actinomycetota bacterium]